MLGISPSPALTEQGDIEIMLSTFIRKVFDWKFCPGRWGIFTPFFSCLGYKYCLPDPDHYLASWSKLDIENNLQTNYVLIFPTSPRGKWMHGLPRCRSVWLEAVVASRNRLSRHVIGGTVPTTDTYRCSRYSCLVSKPCHRLCHLVCPMMRLEVITWVDIRGTVQSRNLTGANCRKFVVLRIIQGAAS
jgi:hypothetical protein